MATANVTSIRSAGDSAAEERELAAYLMEQAVRAAILLLNHGEPPQLAADVLTLARDRVALLRVNSIKASD